ncbi:MAG: ChaN family lipoprotein [Bacteroidales bacterium]
MHRIKLLPLVFIILFFSMKSDKPAYILYDSKGKPADYKDLLKDALKSDVILFGEQHNDPIGHWLQLELTKELFNEKGKSLLLGAEMFESDNQLIINEYLADRMKPKSFESELKLWPNYQTDYKPLMEFARKNKIQFIATNVPRRYAALVNKSGFEVLDSLATEAKLLFAPLPVPYDPELKGYLEMMNIDVGPGVEKTPNLPKSQAIKDATMAHFIMKNYSSGKIVLHFNGSYHSDNYEGIVWYLKKADPSLKVLTISSVDQDTISSLKDEYKGVADYILCVPSNMTKTR